tara:strand:- start:399 stop:971 length:573 start_codon:yes stop_codon:yes gene_type:complete
MPRKARRIKRQQFKSKKVDSNNTTTNHNDTYFILVAKQMATNRQQSWLDSLPDEIQSMIWQKYYYNCHVQIKEFGMYRGIINIYVKRHITKELYEDAKFSRNGKYIAFQYSSNNKRYYNIIETEDSVYNEILGLFSSYASGSKQRIYYKIFNESIVPDITYLYGLCKPIPNNWEFIGRAEDIVAGRFTYN